MRRVYILFLTFFASIAVFGQMSKPYAPNVAKPIGTSTAALPKWSNPATWNNNKVPISTDDVTIPEGSVVVLDMNVDVKHVMVHGVLVVEPSKDITINAHSVQVMGSKAYFEWGTEQQPYVKKGILTLSKSTPTETMPMSGNESKGIMVMSGGILELHGKPKMSWTQLAVTAAKGSKTLTFKEAVDWNVGDSIVVASTDFMGGGTEAAEDINGDMGKEEPSLHENETAKIASISADKKTVTLVDALSFSHWGEAPETFSNGKGKTWVLDERAEVGVLSRTILIQGDAASEKDRHGVNIMVMIGSTGKVSGVELFRVGIGSVLGRYPFHWHLCNNVSGQYFNNNSIHHSYNRAITVHGTQNARLESNVIYDVIGHAIFLEDGIETGNVIDSNLVMSVKKPEVGKELLHSDKQSNKSDRIAGPAGIWMTHPTNTVTNNRISGAGTGIWYAMPVFPTGASFSQANKSIRPREARLVKLDNNTTHSCQVGISFDFMVQADGNTGEVIGLETEGYTPSSKQMVTRQHSFKDRRGIWFRGGSSVGFDDFTIADGNASGSFVPTFSTTFSNGCIVGYSKNSTNKNLLYSGMNIYDGPQHVENCHFENFDGFNQGIIRINGGANKFLGNSIEGITYKNCNLYNPPKATFLEPSPYHSLIIDKDGSITDAPNSTICLDHPFYVDDVNFKDLKSNSGGKYGWGKQTKLKFGAIVLGNTALPGEQTYYEWESPTAGASNGGMYDGRGAPSYSWIPVVVNTDRISKIRFLDSVRASFGFRYQNSTEKKDVVHVVFQGSPVKFDITSRARFNDPINQVESVASIGDFNMRNDKTISFWDDVKKEQHLKIVYVESANNGGMNFSFKNVSGKTLKASVEGMKSRPYNGRNNVINTIVEAERFDNGGPGVAYRNIEGTSTRLPNSQMEIPLITRQTQAIESNFRISELVSIAYNVATTVGNVVAIADINNNEFWKYTFAVNTTGMYDIDMSLLANNNGNSWQILVNDVLVKDTTFGPLGTDATFKKVTFKGVKLIAGTSVVTFRAMSSKMLFDNFRIYKRGTLITDIEEEEAIASKTSIYPNPSQDGIFNLSETANWKVNSVLGKELKTGNSNQINLSDYPKGVYLIKMNEKIERVVVE